MLQDTQRTDRDPALTRGDGARRVHPGLATAETIALVDQLKAGDEAAFRALARSHGPRLLGIARRYLDKDQAQDCLQEALTVAFVKISTLEDPERLGPWLNRVVINCALMRIRSQKRRKEESLDEWLPTFDNRNCRIEPDRGRTPTPEDLMNQAQSKAFVRDAIYSLPTMHRAVLMLRDIDGYSTNEAAEMLEVEPGALKVRLHRARAALKKKLEPLMVGGPA